MKRYLLAFACLAMTASPALAMGSLPSAYEPGTDPVPRGFFEAMEADYREVLGFNRAEAPTTVTGAEINAMSLQLENARQSVTQTNYKNFKKFRDEYDKARVKVCAKLDGC